MPAAKAKRPNLAAQARHVENRSVTEARLLGLVKFHQWTSAQYAAGARRNTVRVLDYAGFYVCRAVQLWQLVPDAAYAVVWIDIAADGIAAFPTIGPASEKFMQIRAGLHSRPTPPILTSTHHDIPEDDEEEENEWSHKLRSITTTTSDRQS